MKAVDDIGWLKEVKSIAPETLTIGRFTGRDTFSLEGDAKEIARVQMDWLLQKAAPNKGFVDFWEPMNEDNPPELWQHQKIAEVMLECMRIANEEGLKLAIFSYSLGTPKIEFWEGICETGVFGFAQNHGHILSLHEGTLEAPAWSEDAVPWLHTRYRLLYDILKKRNEVIPLVISEWCIGAYTGFEADPEEWARQLLWYESELLKDDYVIGVTPFTLTSYPTWESHDYQASVPFIVEALKERETKKEEEVEKVITYESHYVLFPQGSSWEWYEAAKNYFLTFRCTRGESADDAYKRWGSTHTITMISPTWEFLKYVQKHKDEETTIDLVDVSSPEELKVLFDWRAKTGKRFGWPKEPIEEESGFEDLGGPYGLIGLHARNDSLLYPADISMINDAKLEALKFLHFTELRFLDECYLLNPNLYVVVRLYSWELAAGKRPTPLEFVGEMAASIGAWLAHGVVDFEIHNEPNLDAHHWRINWSKPEEFNLWLEQVLTLFRAQFPEARFGFPGLSPMFQDLEWLERCSSSIESCDWLGCHVYWQSWEEMESKDYGRRYELYHDRFPNKTIIITEFSNPSAPPWGEVAEQYLAFYRRLREVPYIKASFSFIMSSPDPAFHTQSWREEWGGHREIVAKLGQRDF